MLQRYAKAKEQRAEIEAAAKGGEAFERFYADILANAARLQQPTPSRESIQELVRIDLRRLKADEGFYKRALDALDNERTRLPPAAGEADYWPTDYAQTNLWEDFAETVSLYLLNPERLATWSPERFAFMRRYVFPEGT
jgi:hypothetical protein